MLRATISMKQNVDISEFNYLIAFLKQETVSGKLEIGDKEFLLMNVKAF